VAGGDLRLDRATLEALLVPLQHLLTNAVDHGLEDADARGRAGKEALGAVRMQVSAGRESLRITVQDDGAGANLAALANRLDDHLLPAASPAGDRDLTDLLCRPGLTTAAGTTATSGRGIGLDAVREAAQRAGGRLTLIQPAAGGLRAELLLPLSVSVSSCLLARAGAATYGIPLASVEVVEDATAAGAPALSLAALLEGRQTLAAGAGIQLRLHSPGQPALAVTVDALLGRLDAVVRPLPSHLLAPAVAGTALCGDGTPVIILDPTRLWVDESTDACPATG
jgi:chemotaxis protein histidine kinase CheA